MKVSEELLHTIKNLQSPALIAISGFGGAGKSTFAEMLGEELKAPVVGVDSFQKNRTDTEYHDWEIMDYSRLEREVLIPFASNESVIRYGLFSSPENKIVEYRTVEKSDFLIVEGVGLFRPALKKYFTHSIWVDCSVVDATERGKKRDREVHKNPQDESWDGVWKQNDLEYIQNFEPIAFADTIIDNSKDA